MLLTVFGQLCWPPTENLCYFIVIKTIIFDISLGSSLWTHHCFITAQLQVCRRIPKSSPLSLSASHTHNSTAAVCSGTCSSRRAAVPRWVRFSPLSAYATHNPLRGAAIGLGAVSTFRKPTAKRTIPKYIHILSGSATLLVLAETEPSCDSHHHVSRWTHVRGGVMWRDTV